MHTFLVSWILLVMFTCCFHAYWRSRSVWCQHISNGTDRLTIAFLSVVVPPVPLAFMAWDLRHNNRHAKESLRS